MVNPSPINGSYINLDLPSVVSPQADLALSLASDVLEGCYKDYLFFRRSSSSSYDEYVLLIGDLDRRPSVYKMVTPEVHQFFVYTDTSGSSPVYTYYHFYYDVDFDVDVYDAPDQCLYSSYHYDAHLVSGGVYYDFALLFAVVVFGVLLGLYRIFRHIL